MQQNWKVQLQETMYNYNDTVYLFYMQSVAWSLISQTEIWKKKKFNRYYKTFVKGTQKRLEKIAKLEAKRYNNFIICSLMRLKLAKVVYWNFLTTKAETVSSWTWTSGQF